MRTLAPALCATVLALAPTCGFGQTYGALYPYGQRPEPPIESSIPPNDKDKPAADAAKPVPPKPVVRQKIVRRIAKDPSAPVTMPPQEVLVMMVRSTLAAVNQANFTENYSVLHGMTTPVMQTRLTPSHFGKAFADLRKQGLDLSPVLVLAPQFSVAPALMPDGLLRLNGFFPSRPTQIDFAIDYRAVGGFWLIEALSVTASQPGANGQAAGAPPPAL